MHDELDEISELKDNILKIISIYEAQIRLNEKLKEDNNKLLKKIKLKENKISELTQKYETLKFAKTLTTSSKDIGNVKLKIVEIVREIDNCISLLNK